MPPFLLFVLTYLQVSHHIVVQPSLQCCIKRYKLVPVFAYVWISVFFADGSHLADNIGPLYRRPGPLNEARELVDTLFGIQAHYVPLVQSPAGPMGPSNSR